MRATLAFAIAIAVAFCAAGCTREVVIIPTVSPSAVATAPRPPSTTGPPSTTATSRPSATASPKAGSATPIAAPFDPDAEPQGYAQSCAAAFPWGRQVTRGFVCIESPYVLQRTPQGVLTGVLVQGYAGGSFENNVVVDLVELAVDGSVARTLAREALTYRAPDAGMPGAWSVSLQLSSSGPPPTGRLRVVAHFESPRDGARVAEDSMDLPMTISTR